MASRPAVQVTHPAPNTHTLTVRTPDVSRAVSDVRNDVSRAVNTDDPKVQGYLIGAGVTIAAAAIGVGLYELYAYLRPRYTQYKLSYFNGRGLAEVSRYLFALAGVEYIDHRFADVPSGNPKEPKRPEFDAVKDSFPFGQVPVLQVGGENGIVLAQSKAIERYLAGQFGFYGCSAIERQLIDSLIDGLRDARDAFVKVRDTEDKPKFFTETLPKHVRYWNRFASTHSTSSDLSTFVGSKISLADIQFFHFMSIFDDQDSITRVIAPYPALKAIRANIASQPQIAKWIAERPKTAF